MGLYNSIVDGFNKATKGWGKRPEPYKYSTNENIAVAATPLLIGLLAGDVGAGAGGASKALEKSQTRENKLSDYFQKRNDTMALANAKEDAKAKAGSKGKPHWVTGTDGIQYLATPKPGGGFSFADRYGIEAPENTKVYSQGDEVVAGKLQMAKALNRGNVKNKADDLGYLKGGKFTKYGDLNAGINEGALKNKTKEQKQFITSTRKEYGKFFENATDLEHELSTIYKLISSPNVIDQQQAVLGRLKQLQGRISDQDYAIFINEIGAKGVANKLKNWTSSKFNPLLIKSIKHTTYQALKNLRRKSKSTSGRITRIAKEMGLSKEEASGLVGLRESEITVPQPPPIRFRKKNGGIGYATEDQRDELVRQKYKILP